MILQSGLSTAAPQGVIWSHSGLATYRWQFGTKIHDGLRYGSGASVEWVETARGRGVPLSTWPLILKQPGPASLQGVSG